MVNRDEPRRDRARVGLSDLPLQETPDEPGPRHIGDRIGSSDEEAAALPGIDTSRAHPARVYDYWLGGKDNFAADREAAEQALQAYPQLAQAVQANRKFLARAVRYLTGEAGIRQFLDIGTGIPAADNTHQVAQREAPDSRIVYVDNDPHRAAARPGLAEEHAAGCVRLHPGRPARPGRDPGRGGPDAGLRPAGGPDAAGDPAVHPRRAGSGRAGVPPGRALPSGSYLVISHPTDDFNPNRGESIKRYNERVADQATLRDQAGTTRFFASLDLIEPGVVAVASWRR